jgi:hypothetical protein
MRQLGRAACDSPKPLTASAADLAPNPPPAKKKLRGLRPRAHLRTYPTAYSPSKMPVSTQFRCRSCHHSSRHPRKQSRPSAAPLPSHLPNFPLPTRRLRQHQAAPSQHIPDPLPIPIPAPQFPPNPPPAVPTRPPTREKHRAPPHLPPSILAIYACQLPAPSPLPIRCPSRFRRRSSHQNIHPQPHTQKKTRPAANSPPTAYYTSTKHILDPLPVPFPALQFPPKQTHLRTCTATQL